MAHRGHRFHKVKTLQIKKFLTNINNTSKKSSPVHCKQKRNCKKIHAHYKQKNYSLQTKLPHTANKTPASYKQNSGTLQTKLQRTANKTPARCKQNYSPLQTKLWHAANKRTTRCKQNFRTLQTKLQHAATKTTAHCKQNSSMLQTKAWRKNDVKDWDLVSWFSWFMAECRELHAGVTRTQTHLMFYSHAMFRGNSQKEARYLSSPVYRCRIDRTVKNEEGLQSVK